jgi:hypothetical protein
MQSGRMTVATGVLGLIGKAGTQADGYMHIINGGDLQQMAAQIEFLQGRGFDVGNSDVYPALRSEEDLTKALRAIFESRVDGWWNLEDQLTKRGICTADEFVAAFGKS